MPEELDPDIQKLGDIYFDQANEIFTYPVVNLVLDIEAIRTEKHAEFTQIVEVEMTDALTIGVLEKPKDSYCLDLKIKMGDGQDTLDEEFLTICSVLPAQILGYYKSVELGLNPDNPSESGVISRVVQGVKIYSFE